MSGGRSDAQNSVANGLAGGAPPPLLPPAVSATTVAATLPPKSAVDGNVSTSVCNLAQHRMHDLSNNDALPSTPSQTHHYDTNDPVAVISPSTPPAGLLNIGEICYLNSVVQVLFHIPSFRQALLRYQRPPPPPVDVDDPSSTERRNAEDIVCELKTLFQELAESHKDAVDPTNLVDMLRDRDRDFEFQADGQQDAHEFLRFLMDNVSTAFKFAEPPPSGQPQPVTLLEQTPPQKRSATGIENGSPPRPRKRPRPSGVGAIASPSVLSSSSRHNKSVIGRYEEVVLDSSDDIMLAESGKPNTATSAQPGHDKTSDCRDGDARTTERVNWNGDIARSLFEGETVSSTRCSECECRSSRSETFLDLSVPVAQGRSLGGLLTLMAAGDSLYGMNKYACENCHTKTEAERTYFISTLPPVLTIHLKLFQFTEQRAGQKIPVATICPFRMRFDAWTTKECLRKHQEYMLTGIIVHNGGYSTSGHYYSMVYRREHNQWFKLDDSSVSRTSQEEIETTFWASTKSRRTVYLCFYSASTS